MYQFSISLVLLIFLVFLISCTALFFYNLGIFFCLLTNMLPIVIALIISRVSIRTGPISRQVLPLVIIYVLCMVFCILVSIYENDPDLLLSSFPSFVETYPTLVKYIMKLLNFFF